MADSPDNSPPDSPPVVSELELLRFQENTVAAEIQERMAQLQRIRRRIAEIREPSELRLNMLAQQKVNEILADPATRQDMLDQLGIGPPRGRRP